MTLCLHLAVELPFDVLALHTKGDDCVSLIEFVSLSSPSPPAFRLSFFEIFFFSSDLHFLNVEF